MSKAAPAAAAASNVAISPPVAPPAERASDAPLLLDSPTTRRAIAESARQRSIATEANAALDDGSPRSPEARLGAEIAKGARGDCAKGEYAGGGMGLLSLPFLAAAVLTEQCRR